MDRQRKDNEYLVGDYSIADSSGCEARCDAVTPYPLAPKNRANALTQKAKTAACEQAAVSLRTRVAGRLEAAANFREGRAQIRADRGSRGDNRNRDQSGDQAVFDRRGAGLIGEKLLEHRHGRCLLDQVGDGQILAHSN
jgi:hypothetical protein